mmetsp:Transcript_5960/g.15152  ORF Transcript_5960/g.15152 Transcript_5960/m.15152 type:complete len:292 (+) Transcript_5960:388-1263(+)
MDAFRQRRGVHAELRRHLPPHGLPPAAAADPRHLLQAPPRPRRTVDLPLRRPRGGPRLCLLHQRRLRQVRHHEQPPRALSQHGRAVRRPLHRRLHVPLGHLLARRGVGYDGAHHFRPSRALLARRRGGLFRRHVHVGRLAHRRAHLRQPARRAAPPPLLPARDAPRLLVFLQPHLLVPHPPDRARAVQLPPRLGGLQQEAHLWVRGRGGRTRPAARRRHLDRRRRSRREFARALARGPPRRPLPRHGVRLGLPLLQRATRLHAQPRGASHHGVVVVAALLRAGAVLGRGVG